MPIRSSGRRAALAALAALCCLAVPRAPADPPKADAEKRYAATYDVSDLLRKQGHTGYARIDDVVKLVVTSVDPECWKEGGDDSLEEVNGTKLEVTTTRARHKEIEAALAAARRLTDVHVDFKCELFEVDRKVFEKEYKGKLKDGGAAAVGGKLVEDLRTRGTRVKDRSFRAADGGTATLLSSRKAVTYEKAPAAGAEPAVYGVVMAGLTAEADVGVSADRRFVRLKVTQRATEPFERKGTANLGGGEEAPAAHRGERVTTTTTTAEVGDGEWLLLATPPAGAKERVRLLLLRPTIYIEEEERAKKNGP